MGENGLGIELNDWRGSDDRILGLKIDSIRPGSISDLNEYFDLGDGILEIDSVSLNTGSLRNGIEIFSKIFLLNFRYNFYFRCGPIFQIPKK